MQYFIACSASTVVVLPRLIICDARRVDAHLKTNSSDMGNCIRQPLQHCWDGHWQQQAEGQGRLLPRRRGPDRVKTVQPDIQQLQEQHLAAAAGVRGSTADDESCKAQHNANGIDMTLNSG